MTRNYHHGALRPALVDAALTAGVAALADEPSGSTQVTTIAAWSLVHGFASLWLDGALATAAEAAGKASAEELARAVADELTRRR